MTITLIICTDCDCTAPADIDTLRLIFLRDQHALCPTNTRTRQLLDERA